MADLSPLVPGRADTPLAIDTRNGSQDLREVKGTPRYGFSSSLEAAASGEGRACLVASISSSVKSSIEDLAIATLQAMVFVDRDHYSAIASVTRDNHRPCQRNVLIPTGSQTALFIFAMSSIPSPVLGKITREI